jgi:hypothetical protein
MTPAQQVLEIDNERARLGLKKKELSEAAEIKPEMYSYYLRRGLEGYEVPLDCHEKLERALKFAASQVPSSSVRTAQTAKATKTSKLRSDDSSYGFKLSTILKKGTIEQKAAIKAVIDTFLRDIEGRK